MDQLDEKPDRLPRFVKRQVSDNRRRLDCDDLSEFYVILDYAKVTVPTYVAANLKRIPSVDPGEVDIIVLASTAQLLSTKIVNLMKKFELLDTRVTVVQEGTRQTVECSADLVAVNYSEEHDDTSQLKQRWADSLKSGGEWQQVMAKKSRNYSKPKITGRGSVQCDKVKAVSRKKVLAAFVSRLDQNTTAEDLSEYLTSSGLIDVYCRKIVPKDGKNFQNSSILCLKQC